VTGLSVQRICCFYLCLNGLNYIVNIIYYFLTDVKQNFFENFNKNIFEKDVDKRKNMTIIEY